MYVKANPLLPNKNTVNGLCGNFDGSKSNDMKTSTGIMASSVKEFVNSWKTGDECEEAKEITPCTLYPDRSAWAQKGNVLTNNKIVS